MSSIAHLPGFGARDMALDLGTGNTLLYVPGRGIVLSEPTLVAVDSRTGEIRAVGIEAKRLLDRGAESLTAVRPLRHGVITDSELTQEMLRRFIRKVYRSRRAHPRAVVVGVPRGATGIEKRAAEEACLSAGARHTHLIDEPLAAAMGGGLPVAELTASVVVDIGAGTSEAAVISLGEIVAWQSIRVAGDELDEAIIRHLRREHGLSIGQQTAEAIKLRIGSALPISKELEVEIRGRDVRSGLPETVVLTSEETRGALERPVARITDAVKQALGRTPPELGSDIIDRGMMLAGGGSLLPGLLERLRQETQMPAYLAEMPHTCVAAGSGARLEQLEPAGESDKDSGRAKLSA
jgi:rod shape-determining protein MreB and related proteins